MVLMEYVSKVFHLHLVFYAWPAFDQKLKLMRRTELFNGDTGACEFA